MATAFPGSAGKDGGAPDGPGGPGAPAPAGAAPSPIDDAISRRLAAPVSRRQLIARALAVGVAATALGAILDACTRAGPATGIPTLSPAPSPSPAITPAVSFGGTPPVVDPLPTAATYGEMLETSAIAPVAIPSPALRALVEEVAADAGIPVATSAVAGRRQARLVVTADDPSFAPQAYRLEIAGSSDGPEVTVLAGDEAGAFNGLLSLARLSAADSRGRWLRAATIDDTAGFTRRGAILDPYVLPDIGVTDASRALLLERLRLGVRYKLNFLDMVDRTPWPELVRYCDDHHVELLNGIGYGDRLTVWTPDEVRGRLDEVVDAGTRSIALCFDDIETTNPEALAEQHARVIRDQYGYLRGCDARIRVSTVLPPYGGVPGQNLVWSQPGEGERYLAVMRDALPADVRVFWTGDGGVFSETVTADGARAYAEAVGREIGLWDNDTIRFSAERTPVSGRAPDLADVVPTYMGNLAGEADWGGTNGELALLTSLFYTWNPGAYDPAAAGAAAERILAPGT